MVTTINASNATLAWQQTYTSPSYTDGTHTVTIKHIGPAGKYIDGDAILIYGPPDTVAPAAIDLSAATGTTNGTVTLNWTAVGDDGTTGTATSYLVRYSTNPIDAANWAAATPLTSGIPTPTAAGTSNR